MRYFAFFSFVIVCFHQVIIELEVRRAARDRWMQVASTFKPDERVADAGCLGCTKFFTFTVG